jgi:hypothetical protein
MAGDARRLMSTDRLKHADFADRGKGNATMVGAAHWRAQLTELIVDRACLADRPLPRDRAAYDELRRSTLAGMPTSRLPARSKTRVVFDRRSLATAGCSRSFAFRCSPSSLARLNRSRPSGSIKNGSGSGATCRSTP